MIRSNKGFILMEVLISIMIISIAMAAAVTGMGRALKLTGRSEEFTRGTLPMETLLFELETGGRADLIEGGGEATVEGREYLVDRRLIVPPKENEDAETTAPPFYILTLRNAGEQPGNLQNAEIFFGQEIFT